MTTRGRRRAACFVVLGALVMPTLAAAAVTRSGVAVAAPVATSVATGQQHAGPAGPHHHTAAGVAWYRHRAIGPGDVSPAR